MTLRWQWIAVAVGTVLLYGCGGDGNSNGNTTPPPPTAHAVGGKINGLSGTGLVLQNNGGDDLGVTTAGDFSFASHLFTGSPYAVTVKSQPSNPSQTCSVSRGSGTVGAADIGDVAVSCSTNSYSAGGTVSGLAGSGLVLQLNGSADLPVAADGTFTFPSTLASGSAYAVAIKTQPTNVSQTCVAANASGTVGGSAVSVSVTCTTNSYSAGGTVSGLAGSGLVLRLNNTLDLAVGANGKFVFAGSLASGSSYAVTVNTQPTNLYQTCVPTNASGIVGGSPVTDISVTCSTNTYTVGGSVTGLTGAGLVLQINGSQDLPVSSNGTFMFPTALPSGSSYDVTIKSQTTTSRERCVATSASGAIAGSSVGTVQVDCTVVLGFVYALGTSNQLFAYGIHPFTGALLPFGPTISTGSATQSLVPAPNGRSLYASDQSDNLYTFAVDSSTGSLSAVGTPISTTPYDSGPTTIAITPSGHFLYVSNILTGTIALFEIDTVSGALTARGIVASAPSPSRSSVGITPDGAFLYELSLNGGSTPTLTPYAIDATTGVLTAGMPVTTAPVSNDLTIDPRGRFLYLHSSTGSPISMSTTTLPFAIDSGTGAVTPVGSGTSVVSNGKRLVVDPSGRYAYLLDSFNLSSSTDDGIDAFSIDQSSGELTRIGARVLLHAFPSAIVCDPSGKFVFVGNFAYAGSDVNSTWHDVSGFTIGAAGASAGQLSPVGLGTALTGSLPAMSVIAVIE